MPKPLREHRIKHWMARDRIVIVVVGCGGTGAALVTGLPYLHYALLAGGHPSGIRVCVIDGDRITETNCVRQPFSLGEVGLYKAQVLINRLNLFWGLDWKAIPQNLTEASILDRPDIVIGCVDTRAARRVIHSKLTGHQANTSYWLDLGNHATGGQFVLGQPWNWVNRRCATRLRTVAELFPELIDESLDKDGQPSCSAVEALERQEPFVNPTLAYHALALLAKLFRHGSTEYHGAFVNVAGSRVQPLLAEPQTWRALRRRGRRHTSRPRAPSARSTTAG